MPFGIFSINDGTGAAAASPALQQMLTSQTASAYAWASATSTTTSQHYQALAANSLAATATTIATTPWWTSTGDNWVEHTQYLGLARARAVAYRERSEEGLLVHEARMRQAQIEYEERVAARQQALDRSRELLLSHLTPVQRSTFEKNAWFVIEGGKSRQAYRIRDKGNLVANIDVMRANKVVHRLCCHCASDVPLYDHLLAQKLHLECNEDWFLSIANMHAA